jgi:hypothetical protein
MSVVLIVVIVATVSLVLFVSTRPAEMVVARELEIKANPEVLFPYINNSKKSNEWMPWHEDDPHVKMSYSGPDEGVGSMTLWTSKGKMGTGSAEVIESIKNQNVKTRLTYTKPMNMSQLAKVSLQAKSDGTLVRWSVSGKNPVIGRIMCAFVNMDKMIGGNFEKGLINLKNIAEKKEIA